jgi:serine/threonine-protein kinase
LAAQIGAGLTAAHRVGVLHRDLKPGNVLLDREGVVRLTDFGIASSVRKDRGEDPSRALFGSPLYMAPEDLGASSPVTQRTDLYSLGVLVYELVTGSAPFDGGDLDTLRELHRFAAPERPSRLAPDVDPVLEDLVLCLLQKRPEDRPPSASACEKAFAAIAARLSSSSGASSPPGDVGEAARGSSPAPIPSATFLPPRSAVAAANESDLDPRGLGVRAANPCQVTLQRVRAHCRGVRSPYAGRSSDGAGGRWAVVTAACRFVDLWGERSELLAEV